MPLILDIEAACRFVSGWFGWRDAQNGPLIDQPFVVPPAIHALNRHLGRLWHGAPPADLFTFQDRLIPPRDYAPDADGIVPILWENQSVWGCGFKPGTGAQLWVTGDWPDDHCGDAGWRATSHRVDQAIIFALLGNTVWAA
ncbi:MAG: hypothetical protein Q4G26_11755, partial [Paracoccus sp. (in: a-proteobacteria)]|nr:hypothetical protein [Paracoccus sp. (in: a-proteobacteria)]